MTSASPNPSVSEAWIHPWACCFIAFASAWESDLSDNVVRQYLDRLLGEKYMVHPKFQKALNIVTSSARCNRAAHHHEFLDCVAAICDATSADVMRILRIANTADELTRLENLVAVKTAGLDDHFKNLAWDSIVQWLRSDTVDCVALRAEVYRLIGGVITAHPWSAAIQLCLLSEETSQSRLYTLVAVLKLRLEEGDARRQHQAAKNAVNPRRSRSTKASQHATASLDNKTTRSSARTRQPVHAPATAVARLRSTNRSDVSQTPTPLAPDIQLVLAPDQSEPDQPTVASAIPVGQYTASNSSVSHPIGFGYAAPSVLPSFDVMEIDWDITMLDPTLSDNHVAPAVSTLELAVMTDLLAYGSYHDYNAIGDMSLALGPDYVHFAMNTSSPASVDVASNSSGIHNGNSQDLDHLANMFQVGADGRAIDADGSRAVGSLLSSGYMPPAIDSSTLNALSDYSPLDLNTAPAWITPNILTPDVLAPYTAPSSGEPLHDNNGFFGDTVSVVASVPASNEASAESALPIATFEHREDLPFSTSELSSTHYEIEDHMYDAPGTSDDEPPPLIPEPGFDDEDESHEDIAHPNPAIVSLVESVLREDHSSVTKSCDSENWDSLFWSDDGPFVFQSHDPPAMRLAQMPALSDSGSLVPDLLSLASDVLGHSVPTSSEHPTHPATIGDTTEFVSKPPFSPPTCGPSGPIISTRDESQIVGDLLHAMRHEGSTSHEGNESSSQLWPQVIRDMRVRAAVGSDVEKRAIEEHFVRLCAKGGALDSTGGGHSGDLAILLVALQSRPVIIGRALDGYTGIIEQLPIEPYIPAHLAAAEFVFEGNLPARLRPYKEAKAAWMADVSLFVATNTPLAERWADLCRRTLASLSDVEVDRLQALYTDTVLPPINESVLSDPDAPPSNVRPAKINGYIFLPEHPLLLRRKGVILSNVDWIYRISSDTDAFDFGHDTLLPQMVAPGHLFACAVRSPPDKLHTLSACALDPSLVSWIEVSLNDFDACDPTGSGFPTYRAGDTLSKALRKAVEECRSLVNHWHRHHQHLHVEYPADLLERTMAVYKRVVSDGVTQMEVHRVMETLQRLIRSLQAWWRYRSIVDQLLADRQRYAIEIASRSRRGPEVADTSSFGQPQHDVVGLFVRTWSEFMLFAQLNIPVWFITTVEDNWTTSVPPMLVREPPPWIQGRLAVGASAMDERSLGEMASLLSADDSTQIFRDEPNSITRKKRRADSSAAGGKRRKISDGFSRIEVCESVRRFCCKWPDIEHDVAYDSPEYWHASRYIWCTPEEFAGITPEEIGAPPPIAQSFIFYDAWNHAITQPNLCLSRMRQFDISTASKASPITHSGLNMATDYRISTSLDAGLEMRLAAPPIRAFTAGQAHRRSQAACAFMGMLDIIGWAVIVNPIDLCGFRQKQWFKLLHVSSLDDFDQGIWWPRRTAEYFSRFGISFSQDATTAPGTVGWPAGDIIGPAPSSCTPSLASSSGDTQPVPDPSSATGSQPGSAIANTLAAPPALIRHLLVQQDERPAVGRRMGSEGFVSCFVVAAAAPDLFLQPESRRCLYRPQHYLQLSSGSERPMPHFHFFVQRGVVANQFVFMRVSSVEGNELALSGKDTYVNYDHNAILVFNAFPHAHGRSATGEQMLSKPVLLMDRLATPHCDRRLLELRVWHHWRTCPPAPTQHRNQVGSRFRPTPPSNHFVEPCSSENDECIVVADVFSPGQRPPSFAQTFVKPKKTVHFMGVPWPDWEPVLIPSGVDKAYEWIKGAHHELLLWIACNLLFFVSLISFDSMLRASHPSCPRLGRMPWSKRLALYRVLWGGPTPIPNLSVAQLVTHSKYEGLEMRRPLVVAFSLIVGAWPRVHLPPPPSPEDGQEAFLMFEHRVWVAFLVTWLDYLRRPPPFPVPIPKVLPVEFSHFVPATRG